MKTPWGKAHGENTANARAGQKMTELKMTSPAARAGLKHSFSVSPRRDIAAGAQHPPTSGAAAESPRISSRAAGEALRGGEL
jgi:hypothetical protein